MHVCDGGGLTKDTTHLSIFYLLLAHAGPELFVLSLIPAAAAGVVLLIQMLSGTAAAPFLYFLRACAVFPFMIFATDVCIDLVREFAQEVRTSHTVSSCKLR